MEGTMTTTTTDQHTILAEIDRHLDAATRATRKALDAAEQYDTDPAVRERLDAIYGQLRALEAVVAAQS
jgi:adenosine deaminase